MSGGRAIPLALLAAASTLSGCRSERAAPAASDDARPLPDIPKLYANAFNAHAVGDRARLWLAVSGKEGAESSLSVKVLSTDGSTWTTESAPGKNVDQNAAFSLALVAGRPCLAGSDSGDAFVICLRDGGWSDTRLPARRGEQVLQIVLVGSALHALLRTTDGTLRTVALQADRWRSVGQPLRLAQAIVRAAPSGAALTVAAATGGSRPARIVYRLRHRRWERLGSVLRGPAYGPFPGTPLARGGRVLLPVTEASRMPWRFSVYELAGGRWHRREAGSAAGAGSAQGSVGSAGREDWAIWQESRQRGDSFATRIYVQRLTGEVARRRLLWRGTSLGPSDVEVIEALGRPWALFMPGTPLGLEVRVARL